MYHGKVITYHQLDQIRLGRKSFLQAKETSRVDKIIEERKPLLFLPSFVTERNLPNFDNKYTSHKYKIVVSGILQDGRRVNVIIDGILPYFEIRVPDDAGDDFVDDIEAKLSKEEITRPERISVIKAKPFKYYQEHCSRFVRLYYNRTKHKSKSNRDAGICFAKKEGYETTTDDRSSYYRVVCRDYQTTFSSWVELTNYSPVNSGITKDDTFLINIKHYLPYKGDLTPELMRDKTLACAWDIETWSRDSDGDLPDPDKEGDCIFCLSMNFKWIHEKQSFLNIALCDYPSEPRPDYLTVVCGHETNIIKAFAYIFEKLSPEFIYGFNDSDYDWRWILDRSKQTKGLLIYLAERFSSIKRFEDMTYNDIDVYKYNRARKKIKIDAENSVIACTFMNDGYIPTDVRTMLRRLPQFKTSEKSSLSYFLEASKLPSKDYMPYTKLFRIYKEYRELYESKWVIKGTKLESEFQFEQDTPNEIIEQYNRLKSEFADVNKYCVVDSERCHDLMQCHNIIPDCREVANLSYVSLMDSFYFADGMKVRNLTIAIGQRAPFNIRFSNSSEDDAEPGKYPGAFVVPPKKGLKISKLTMEERIQKAILTKNTANPAMQEWLKYYENAENKLDKYYDIIDRYGPILTEEEIKTIEKTELDGKMPKEVHDFFTEEIGRPIAGLDFSSLYPSLIRAYNLSPEYCVIDRKYAKKLHETGHKLIKVDFDFNGRRRLGYFVWHNNHIDPTKPEFKFGVYPYILNDLFMKRAVLKKMLGQYKDKKEEMLHQGKEYIDAHREEYEDLDFNLRYVNSKQNAVKVFMNTFYGEAGNKNSPFFVLEVAGGVTLYGRKNLQLAYRQCRLLGCNVYYGDSVAEYTPVLIRKSGVESYCEIKDLVNEDQYELYNDGKEIAFLEGYEIWSDLGWTKLKHVIRHKTNKKMYRVLTHNSVVDVTEDHSLLDEHGTPIKPSNVLGKKLLTHPHPIEQYSYDLEELAYCTSQLEACEYYKKYRSQGYNVALRCLDASRHTPYIVIKESKNILCSSVLKVIELLNTETYVYDVETENHHFSAGVGEIVVHNTDSLYISTPEQDFKELDRLYYTGKMLKLEYWHKLVETSFKSIQTVRNIVNKAFFDDNGTEFLTMAYEEFLYPVAFLAKKKYYGIPHEKLIKFDIEPKHLFVRGLEVKKRGVSEMLRQVCTEIMMTTMQPSNLYELIELVLQKIDDFYRRSWEMKDFISTAVYKPNKKNVRVHTFVQRMKEIGIIIKPAERFEYVIVRKYPYKYDYRGRKVELSAGDRMELADRARELKMEIDMDYYMSSSIEGQFGRLITYHPIFHVDPIDDSPDELKAAENTIYKNACKFVNQYAQKYFSNYNTFGKAYQSIFRTVNKTFNDLISQKDTGAAKLLGLNIDIMKFEEDLIEHINKYTDKQVAEYGKKYVEAELKYVEDNIKYEDGKLTKAQQLKNAKNARITMMQKSYYNSKKSILNMREAAFNDTMNILRRRIQDNIDEFSAVYNLHRNNIEVVSNIIKKELHIDDKVKNTDVGIESQEYSLDDFDIDINKIKDELVETASVKMTEMLKDKKIQDVIEKFKDLYGNIVAAYIMIKRTRNIVDTLKMFRNTKHQVYTEPSDTVLKKSIEDGVQECMANNVNF